MGVASIIKTPVPATSAATHPVLDDLRGTTAATLAKRLERMFAKAPDALLEMSDKAASEAERRAHFDAMRVLGFEQARILRTFEREIARGFDGAPGPQAVESSADLRMVLLPEQDMDENLALDRAASKARTRSKTQFNPLEARLKALETELALGAVHRAIDPRTFCNAYSACLNKLDLAYAVRKLLQSVFETLVLDDLDTVYREVHEALDRHAPRLEAPPASQVVMQLPGDQRAEVLAKIQRVVSYELAALVNGRRLHPGARRFLCCAMAPLMSVRLLRHGVHSKLWHDALTRVGHILRTLESRQNQPEQRHARAEYVDATVSDLREIGFPENRIAELLGALQEAFVAADAATPQPQAQRSRAHAGH